MKTTKFTGKLNRFVNSISQVRRDFCPQSEDNFKNTVFMKSIDNKLLAIQKELNKKKDEELGKINK